MAGPNDTTDETMDDRDPPPATGEALAPSPDDSQTVPLPRDWASECCPADILRALHLPSDRFVVEGKLGDGATGTVYAIRDRYLERTVAVKFASTSTDPSQVSRFLHEARVTASIEHPNIVPVFHFDQASNGRFYLAMRRIQGQSLGDVIDRSLSDGQRHPLIAVSNDVVNIALKVCEAVGCAHARGVCHLDIKPDNIMLGEYGEVLLIDWGVASGTSKEGRRGTPAYMAPEQARREGGNTRSDTYGIGATMFHALFLRHPTRAGNAEEFWARKQRGELDRPEAGERRRVPAPLTAIVLKALEADPARRYPSVDALKQDLQAFQAGLSVSAYRESVWELLWRWYRLRRRMCNAIAAMLVILAGVCGYYVVKLDRAHRAATAARLEALELADQAHKLEQERASRWEPVVEQDFEHQQTMDPRWKLDGPVRFERKGLPMSFDAALKQLVWTQPIGIEQKVEVVFSCDTSPFIEVGLCMNDDEQRTTISLEGESVLLAAIDPEWRLLVSFPLAGESRLHRDRPNTLTAWREGSTFHVDVNGHRVGTYLHATAPSSEAYGRFGLDRYFGYSPLTVHALRVYRRISPDYVSVLEPGKALLREGRLQAAFDWFESHGRHRLSRSLEQEAEYLATRALSKEEDDEREKRLRTIIENNAHAFQAQAMHDFALLLSRTDRWKETLDTACRASRLAPGLSTLDAISKRLYVQLRALPQEEKQAALRQIARLPLLNLSLANFGIADLTILEGTEARALDVSHNPVANLDPLKGLQLRSLMLGPAPITDLSPLRGMPLKLLTLKGLPVKDLTPLRGLPLESLRLLNCPAIDFGTLTGVKPRLLHIEGCSIQDPSVLEHTGASIVRIGSTPLSDLRFMKGLPLQGLWLANNGLSDLEPLRGAKVVKCVIRDNRVEDLGPLSDCPRLDNLILTGNPVRDLSPLRKLTLRALVIADTNVTDLTALGELPLKSLDLSHTGVTDLSPLAGRPLESLFMRGTTVRKLDPLSSLPGLKHLDVSERALDDEALRVLAGLSLVKLEIDLDAKTLAVLSRMKTLQQVGPFTARYIRRVAPAIAKALAAERIDSAQVHRLRALATPQHGVERLLVPMPMSYAQAAAFCQTLGASLACPSTRQEADDLAECLGSGGHRWDLQVWIGLENRNGVLLIPSGANVEWLARQLPPVAKEALLHGARLLISRASIEEGLSSYSWTYPDSADGNKSTKLPFVVEWRTPR